MIGTDFPCLAPAFAPFRCLPVSAFAAHLSEQLQVAARALESSRLQSNRDWHLTLQCSLWLVARTADSLGDRRKKELLVGDVSCLFDAVSTPHRRESDTRRCNHQR